MGWLLGQMRADFGFGAAAGPIWLRDNPFLRKSERAELRRGSLLPRLAAVIAALGGLLVGGLVLEHKYGGQMAGVINFVFHTSFPVVLFVLLSFVHVLLIANARTAASVSLADEARRVTLPDLLMTPLRRAEMLIAMGIGPARSAFLLALAGLPVYALLGQFGGLTAWEIVCLYILFALLCYQPPASSVPALSGLAQAPDAPPGQSAAAPNRQMARRATYLGIGFPIVLGMLFFGRFLGALGGGWLTHLFSALNLPLLSAFSFLIFFAWPYYAVQLLSDCLPFFHVSVSPLFYVLPLMGMQWAGAALSSASALSAGDLAEMRRLPIWTRAQTLSRGTARLAGLCALGVVWRAWVESGDTAGLAKEFAAGPAWGAAGLLILLGGFSLPNVCGRALAISPLGKDMDFRSPALVLRRALKRSLRPLGVALGVFLMACLLGGLSPFAMPVYEIAGKIGLVGVSTVFWAVGIRRAIPKISKWVTAGLLYGVPALALSVPGFSPAAAFSPASAWVRLFAGGPGLLSQFHVWHLGPLPSFWVCAAVPLVAGMVLMTVTHRQTHHVQSEAVKSIPAKSAPAKRVVARNEARTAALMGWVTRHADNPLLIYEMRVRTRSGRWFDWLILSPLGFAAAVIATLVFPDVVESFSFLSPFQFFYSPLSLALGSGTSVSGQGYGAALLVLASLLLLGQCYTLGFRGQVIGESLISKDRQQGTWGFLLLTPLTAPQIFWGKVFGQTAAALALWAAAGIGSLVLYLACVPVVGLGPALGAWGSGQLLVAALLTLGVGLGTALATLPVVQKTLKGLSTLLLVVVAGGIVSVELKFAPMEWDLAARIFFGSLFALALSAALFWFALWRLTKLRGRDITAGDGVG
jgi:hypothetical protein